jgi:hypothetical protein
MQNNRTTHTDRPVHPGSGYLRRRVREQKRQHGAVGYKEASAAAWSSRVSGASPGQPTTPATSVGEKR